MKQLLWNDQHGQCENKDEEELRIFDHVKSVDKVFQLPFGVVSGRQVRQTTQSYTDNCTVHTAIADSTDGRHLDDSKWKDT